jgi:hypothetical protein
VNPPVLDRTRGCTSSRNLKKPALPERHEAIDVARLDVADVVDKRTDSEADLNAAWFAGSAKRRSA